MVELTDRQKLEMYRSLNKGGAYSSSSPNLSTLSTMGERYLNKKVKNLQQEKKDTAPMSTSVFYDEDVDYKTGVQDLGFRSKWARRDNDQERDLFLNKSVGEKGIDWDRDTQGRYVITPRGQQKLGLNPIDKKLAIDETGMSMDDVVEFFSSYGLPIALGTAGAIAAPLTGGTSLLGALGLTSLGAGAGTFAGVLADEGVEAIEGYQAEKASDVFQRAAMEALFAAAAEGVVGGAILGGARLLKGPGSSLTPGLGGKADASQSNFAEAILRKDKNLLPQDIKGNLFEQLLDPANANKTVKLRDGTTVNYGELGQEISDMMPNVKNLSDKEILATAQKVAEVIFPNKKAQARNAQAFAAAVRGMKATLNQKGKLDPADITEQLRKAFPEKEALKEQIDLSKTKFNQLMQEAFGQQGLKSIKGLDGSPRVLDKNELLSRVEAGKRLFQAQSNAGYKTVDDLISGGVKRLLPKLKTNKIEFENIANQLEKVSKEVAQGESLKKYVKFLRTKIGEDVTLSELNHIRAILRGEAFDGTIGQADKLALQKAVDILDNQILAYKTTLGEIATKTGNKSAKEAFEVLGKTEEFYKEGIGLFNNARIGGIIEDASGRGNKITTDDIITFLKTPEETDALLLMMNPTRFKSFKGFQDKRLKESLKFMDEESPILTQYKKDQLRANATPEKIANDPFVKYMTQATEESSKINQQINKLLTDGKRVDDQLRKSLAAVHWTKLFGDDALQNSKGFGTQATRAGELDVAGRMVINPNAVWKEFTQNKFALEKIYGKKNYEEITNILGSMTDNGIDTLPLEAFTQIAGKEAGDLINSLRQAQSVLDFTLRGDDAVRAIMAARRSPDALNKIGKQFIKPETSPLEISEVKNLLKAQGMNTQTVDDMFADMTINKILGDDLMTNQLSGDDLLNGIITSRLDKYVGDGATYSRQTLEQLLGGGQAGKNAYENLKDLWRFSRLISESSTRGLSALKGASERTALAGFALLFAPGATIGTAIGSLGLRELLRSKGVMKFLATRPRGVKSKDELLSKSNLLKRFATRSLSQPLGGAASRGQQKAKDVIEEQAKEIFKEATPEGTEQVTETQTETVRPKRVSMPMPPPQSNPPGIERKIALGAAGNSPLNQALLRSRSV